MLRKNTWIVTHKETPGAWIVNASTAYEAKTKVSDRRTKSGWLTFSEHLKAARIPTTIKNGMQKVG